MKFQQLFSIILYHIFENIVIGIPSEQIINHGYLAVEFFYVLSGFVIGYAYDDRWDKMSLRDFFIRRLIRLHPMVIAGTITGFNLYIFQQSNAFPLIENVEYYKFFLHLILSFLMIPCPPSLDIRGWQETNAFNGPNWTLTYEYLSNILYALIICNLFFKGCNTREEMYFSKNTYILHIFNDNYL